MPPLSTTNIFLNAISIESRQAILTSAELLPLPARSELHKQERDPRHVYFLTSGIASVVVNLAEGGSAEVALIGTEGLTASLSLLGPALPSADCFMQVAGSGYRVEIALFRRFFLESEEVRAQLLRFVQFQSLLTSQIAACNRLHEAEARISRWLLMVHDRIHQDSFSLTQEFLAQMLGTQRPTVSIILGTLQRAGLVEVVRGGITIRSRENLEQAACDCYLVTRRLLQGLYK